MMRTKLLMVFGAIITAVMFLTVNSAVAKKAYPNKPITTVCSYKAGGDSDSWQRIAAKIMEKYLDQPLIVVNKPGGGGMVTLTYVMRTAPADGYTISHISGSHASSLARGMKGPDFRTEVEILGSSSTSGIFLGARADSKYKTFQDFIDDCKARPGKVKVAVAGIAGTYAMPLFILRDKAKIDFEIVPFGSISPAWVELLGGRIDLASATWTMWGPYVKPEVEMDKRLRPLVAFAEKRYPASPKTPTSVELGYDVTWKQFLGFGVHKDTPKHIVKVLKDAFYKTAHDREYLDMCAKAGKLAWEYKTPGETMDIWYEYYNTMSNLKKSGIIK